MCASGADVQGLRSHQRLSWNRWFPAQPLTYIIFFLLLRIVSDVVIAWFKAKKFTLGVHTWFENYLLGRRQQWICKYHHTTTILLPFFQDHPGEPMPEENFWTLWCKGRLTEADTLTIRLGATPSGLTSAHLYHPPIFLRAGCPSCRPTNSVKAQKATSTFGLGRRR